tara:strand:- start:355 stop:507 length:153 start_codon:yes stop_codon:yes gene_type:complete
MTFISDRLKESYEKFWVPVFGRILMRFVSLIEKKKPKEKPTYDLTNKNFE